MLQITPMDRFTHSKAPRVLFPSGTLANSTRRLLASLALCSLLLGAGGCRVTTHPVADGALGTPTTMAAMLEIAAEPGPVEVNTVDSADWQVDRSGLINLENPKAKAAKLGPGMEPIGIFFHALIHPTQGLYLVDTGVEKAFRDQPNQVPVNRLIKRAMHLERLRVREPLGDYLKHIDQPVRGVFFTHLHLDHVLGARDLPPSTPLYVGPGETRERAFLNAVVQGTTNAELEGKPPLREWHFDASTEPEQLSVIDLFGDRTAWAIWVPGHTPGSVAFLVRTPKGPVLLTGDACHTRWGWENQVEPGTFSADLGQSATSLRALEAMASHIPGLDVRFGHQR